MDRGLVAGRAGAWGRCRTEIHTDPNFFGTVLSLAFSLCGDTPQGCEQREAGVPPPLASQSSSDPPKTPSATPTGGTGDPCQNMGECSGGEDNRTNIPAGTPRIYRGGDSLQARPKIDVKIDAQTGLVKPTRGVSLSTDAAGLAQRFGSAKEVVSIPEQLQVVRTSATHYELAPRYAMTFEEYQSLLSQVILK
jgi:hypothetical protein